jgi:hypothetical protein
VRHGVNAARAIVENQEIDHVFEIRELDPTDTAVKDRKELGVFGNSAGRVAQLLQETRRRERAFLIDEPSNLPLDITFGEWFVFNPARRH